MFKSILFGLVGLLGVTSLDTHKPVYIALTLSNTDAVYDKLREISDPLSRNYGNWLDKGEVDALVGANTEGNRRVMEWLGKENVDNIYNYGDAIKFVDTHNRVNELFKVEEDSYEESYEIPLELKQYIDFVEMSVKPMERKAKINRRAKSEEVDDRYFGRESMVRLYNLPNKSVGKAVSGGLVEYQSNQGFTNEDLNSQQEANGQVLNNLTNIVGNNVGTDAESELDVQLISQAADDIHLWYWQTPYWLYSMAVDFNSAKAVPEVLSMSWGWAEDRQCDIVSCVNMTSKQYINRVNYEYAKILLRGTTILSSSGDAGAPGRTSEGCDDSRPVNAIFPSSSAFVLSVGATYVKTERTNKTSVTHLCKEYGCVEGSEERVVNYADVGWTAGGGFSNHTIATPWWQTGEVTNYLATAPSLPDEGTFNANGRAYPDVSLVGHSCPTYIEGTLCKVDGTSCSSPLMAGVVAVINKHQIYHGRNKVGYFNPLLYHIARECDDCFNDVEAGNNWCTEMECCDNPTKFGYQAVKGFDPVTGLGTPNVGNILAFLDTR